MSESYSPLPLRSCGQATVFNGLVPDHHVLTTASPPKDRCCARPQPRHPPRSVGTRGRLRGGAGGLLLVGGVEGFGVGVADRAEESCGGEEEFGGVGLGVGGGFVE